MHEKEPSPYSGETRCHCLETAIETRFGVVITGSLCEANLKLRRVKISLWYNSKCPSVLATESGVLVKTL